MCDDTLLELLGSAPDGNKCMEQNFEKGNGMQEPLECLYADHHSKHTSLTATVSKPSGRVFGLFRFLLIENR